MTTTTPNQRPGHTEAADSRIRFVRAAAYLGMLLVCICTLPLFAEEPASPICWRISPAPRSAHEEWLHLLQEIARVLPPQQYEGAQALAREADGSERSAVALTAAATFTEAMAARREVVLEPSRIAMASNLSPTLAALLSLELYRDEEVAAILGPNHSEATDEEGVGSLHESPGLARRLLDGGVAFTAYSEVPMGEGKLAFGDLGFQEEESQSAFLYYRDNGKYRIFYRLSTESVVRNQYVTNMPYLELPYLASFDNAGYILFLDETPHIGKVISDTEGIFELPRFPQDFRTRPRLERQPGWADLRQVTAFYRILESSSTVKALYAWNQHIYLLARQSLEWWLIKLDPRDGAELLRTRLPTSAANLTAEPETHGWILTERASVEGVGELHAPYMETLAQVYIPANWMYRNQTGLSPAEPRDECISIGPSKEERRP